MVDGRDRRDERQKYVNERRILGHDFRAVPRARSIRLPMEEALKIS